MRASASSASSDSTTPLPIRQRTCSRRIPEGISDSTVLLAADDQRVAGVVPALEARDRGGALGEQVDDLAFAFIAPLGADDDHELAHRFPLSAPGTE